MKIKMDYDALLSILMLKYNSDLPLVIDHCKDYIIVNTSIGFIDTRFSKQPRLIPIEFDDNANSALTLDQFLEKYKLTTPIFDTLDINDYTLVDVDGILEVQPWITNMERDSLHLPLTQEILDVLQAEVLYYHAGHIKILEQDWRAAVDWANAVKARRN